jgi:hypothetical protein
MAARGGPVMFKNSILVDLKPFVITVSEYGQVVRTITNFSVGRAGHHTPLFENGSLSLTKRDRYHTSNIYPPPNGGAPMYYALFFTEAPSCAFHEGNPNVASHGCIHLVQRDAAWLWDWAMGHPVGLTIRGPYPASSIPVQRTYKMGAANMDPAKISAIQQALKMGGFYEGSLNGIFDIGTDEAVRRYQAANGLVEDGIVGRNTAAKLGVAL